MMHECSPGEEAGLHSCILTTKDLKTLKHYVVLKGLKVVVVSEWVLLVLAGLNRSVRM